MTPDRSEGVPRIRPIRADDGPRYRDARIRMLGQAPEAFVTTVAEALATPAAAWAAQAAELAGGEWSVLFAAETDGRWYGTARGILAEDGRTVDIMSVWVDAPCRGRRLAGRLVQRVLDWAAERNATHARLGVNETNRAAIRSYERLGFTLTGEREPMGADDGRVCAIMGRPLGPVAGGAEERGTGTGGPDGGSPTAP